MSEIMLRRRGEVETDNGPVKTIMWDACRDCDPENCPIRENCPYENQSEKCHIMRLYLNEMFSSALKVTGKHLNNKEMVRIGMHLIPLYSQLCWLKLHYKALDNPLYATNTGIKVHPVLKEMREVIKSIDSVWSSVGVKSSVTDSYGNEQSIEGWLNGDDSYYEDMVNEE